MPRARLAVEGKRPRSADGTGAPPATRCVPVLPQGPAVWEGSGGKPESGARGFPKIIKDFSSEKQFRKENIKKEHSVIRLFGIICTDRVPEAGPHGQRGPQQ